MAFEFAASGPREVRANHSNRNYFRAGAFGEHGDSSVDRLNRFAVAALALRKDEHRFTVLQSRDCDADCFGIAFTALHRKCIHTANKFSEEFLMTQFIFSNDWRR